MWLTFLLMAIAGAADAPSTHTLPVPDAAPAWRVVGGEPAPPGKWPEAAALTYVGGFVACSGVLIHPEWVLTAGHCSATVEQVLLDTTDAGLPGEAIAADAFVAYPDAFDTYDVALVHLASPASSPVARLALDCIVDDHLVDGAAATLVGFGSTSVSGGSAAGLQYEVDIAIGDANCGDPEAGCNTDVMPGGELIAGGNGEDSCDGDSGGPLFLHTPYGPYLVGTTSRAAIPASQPCGDGGIYVRTDAIADWFESTTGETLERPDCDAINRSPAASVPALTVPMGGLGSAQIDVDDPNPFDLHEYALESAARHGTVGVGPRGTVIYGANPGYAGTDRFQVRITDNGTPPLTTVLDVHVTITPYQSGRACNQASAHGSWLWGLLLLVLGRRRR